MVSKDKIKINPRVGNVHDTPIHFEGVIRKTATEKKATLLVPTIAGPRHARTEHHTTTPPPRRLPL